MKPNTFACCISRSLALRNSNKVNASSPLCCFEVFDRSVCVFRVPLELYDLCVLQRVLREHLRKPCSTPLIYKNLNLTYLCSYESIKQTYNCIVDIVGHVELPEGCASAEDYVRVVDELFLNL